MELLAALCGAIIGGLFVTVGDLMARRREWRTESVRELSRAAGDLSAAYLGVFAAASEARKQQSLLEDGGYRPDRYAALTRFFMVPGSETLRREVIAVTEVLERVVAAYDGGDEEWNGAREALKLAVFQLEAAVRDSVRAGRLPR